MTPGAVRSLASGFGAGYAPVASGTFGTLVAVPAALLLNLTPLPVQAAALVASLPLAAAVCGDAERASGRKDPGWIVLDEIVGFGFATFGLAPGVTRYLAAFLLFRLFDILKPPPAGWVDAQLPGGWGILLDDVLAGLYTRGALLVVGWLGLFWA